MSTAFVSSQQLYQWYHSHYMYDITSSICETFCPLYLWHRTHYVWHHKPLCWLHHTRHMYDTICTTEDVTFTLLLQATIFMTSHSTSGMTSHTLYQTSHQLYLCHHNLSTDITPTFLWHHTHYMSDIICTLCNIISNSYVITLIYVWEQNLTYGTTSSMQFKIYTIHVTSQSLFCVITPTVLRASHPLFVWHHTQHRYNIFCTIEDITSSLYEMKPSFLWNHTHYIWHHINAISVTTSTVLMISHQLYLWDHILYLCRHHIHCIKQHIHYICTLTATVPVCHTHCFHDITPFVYMTLHSLYV